MAAPGDSPSGGPNIGARAMRRQRTLAKLQSELDVALLRIEQLERALEEVFEGKCLLETEIELLRQPAVEVHSVATQTEDPGLTTFDFNIEEAISYIFAPSAPSRGNLVAVPREDDRPCDIEQFFLDCEADLARDWRKRALETS